MGALTPQATLVSFNDAGQRAGTEHVWIYRAVFISLLAGAVIQFGLAAMFVRRYGRKFAGRTAERAERKPRRVWWRPWLPTRGVALAWLAWREALPLCLPGLAIACLLTPINMDWWELSREEAAESRRMADEQEYAEFLAKVQSGEMVIVEEGSAVDYPGDASEVPAEVRIKWEPSPSRSARRTEAKLSGSFIKTRWVPSCGSSADCGRWSSAAGFFRQRSIGAAANSGSRGRSPPGGCSASNSWPACWRCSWCWTGPPSPPDGVLPIGAHTNR